MIYVKNLEDEVYLQAYRQSLANRGGDSALLDQAIEMNLLRKKRTQELETKKAEQKKASEQIGSKKKKGEDASSEMAAVQKLKEEIKGLEESFEEAKNSLDSILLQLPNKVHESVPVGKSDADNRVERTVGEKPSFAFAAKAHHEIAEAMGIVDFERASKVAGARFSFLLHWGAKLERALMNFMLDLHTDEHGYKEVIPPYLVNTESMYGTGQFPKFQEDVFHIKNFPFYLIPTAEAPMTNYYRDEMLNEEDLPQRFAAYSSCFRSEAGSYGKDTKGLIRQHQFEKVELMTFVHPDKSYEEHDRLTQNAEEVLKRLELHYRVSTLCTGDISFGAAKCYDIEVWLPGENAYREISSCSNFEDFQARRINTRFRPKGGGKPQYVHTLNGSGLAIGRTVIAVIENYQQEDGSIRVPKVLQKYLGTEILK
ncbi:MAG: serine--tRNA ligase [Bdellovibrionales bacterium]|nr:serine--tRNA ligase [Bdellovibrionales bacterium]